ncbi:unnamed protein product [Fraxinus pennsylvanica]|uniref:Alpha/beta hydrolase fold-3 domain-containing protein n=1 Tax=Fraxinus pennsylvanica TaxID=56036 RepID=A0AAD2EAL3_9LAMI|nr:unnamed protein product [Fraxinus pennsylvanica]
MADSKEIESHTWKEVFLVLGFNWKVTREIISPMVNATPFLDPNQPNQVAFSKDVPLKVPGSNFKSFPFITTSITYEYRLAPENPLPVAYEDALHAILWLKSQAQHCLHRDPWLDEFADFSEVFIMGESAGGNIAYHAALRATKFNLRPMRIQGVILDQAFFGGVERTSSELRLVEDARLPLYVNDAYWSLALPFQAN